MNPTFTYTPSDARYKSFQRNLSQVNSARSTANLAVFTEQDYLNSIMDAEFDFIAHADSERQQAELDAAYIAANDTDKNSIRNAAGLSAIS